MPQLSTDQTRLMHSIGGPRWFWHRLCFGLVRQQKVTRGLVSRYFTHDFSIRGTNFTDWRRAARMPSARGPIA